jgi:primosomal protein N' (replication factor Y)|tara:strand:+ start:64 stop:2271 length:2208 start_codon:yes stop_codon:yes gene_type:complete
MSSDLVEVLVPIPLMEKFSYLPPKSNTPLKQGARVLIPFGRRTLVGVVWGFIQKESSDNRKYKHIQNVLDESPLLDANSIGLAEWSSRYYHYPLGEIISYFFPPSIRKGKEAKFKESKYLELTSKGSFLQSEDLTRAPSQQKLIELLKEKKEISLKSAQAFGISAAVINGLVAKGYITRFSRELSPYKKFENKKLLSSRKLNPEQRKAVNAINDAQKKNITFLLDGITGSGKTEVYLQAIQEIVSQGKQALILIPEIGLAPQAEERFREYFGDRVMSFHSAKNDREKVDAWLGASRGLVDIIIGTRSSVFLPMKNLGIIVVDEEHDLSFKQMDKFRYSARDMALYRAKLEKVPVVLASATPSLETLKNAEEEKYKVLKLSKRATGASLPSFQAVDLRGKELYEGLSKELLEATQSELTQGNQVLIFLNRRGYAPSMICKVCGWISNCERCDALMTVHKNPLKLHCHHCEAQKPYPNKCQSCGSNDFLTYGFGTEKIEEFLQNHFPEIKTLRIDSDSTRKKETLNEYFGEIREGKPMILLGTQLLAKGHHFPDVTLVGIIDADSGLFSADFRGSERVAQLMTQVSGRAGRDKKPGRVILQSYCPDHPQIEEIITGSYEKFAKKLLEERKSSKIPPFSFQAKIFAESPKSLVSRDFILNLVNQPKIEEKTRKNVRVIGPLPSVMEKKSGVYRWELSIFSNNRSNLHKYLDVMQSRLYDPKLSKQVRWSIDVDPLSSI